MKCQLSHNITDLNKYKRETASLRSKELVLTMKRLKGVESLTPYFPTSCINDV